MLGSGNYLVDALDNEWEEECRDKKKRQREAEEELINCEEI